MKDHIAVTVGVPSHSKWDAGFGMSLAGLVAGVHMANNLPMNKVKVDIGICNTQGSNICKNRSEIIKTALGRNDDYVLFLDSDMVFPMHTLHRLLSHGKDIVGANYVKRKEGEYDSNSQDLAKKMIVTKPDSTGLVKADFVGTGIMLIKADVFKRVEKPWFGLQYIEAKDDYGSDDVFFCRKARENGYSIWVDHDLSKEIGHIGEKVYKHYYEV
jgi:GT2 family glycosyltransferase